MKKIPRKYMNSTKKNFNNNASFKNNFRKKDVKKSARKKEKLSKRKSKISKKDTNKELYTFNNLNLLWKGSKKKLNSSKKCMITGPKPNNNSTAKTKLLCSKTNMPKDSSTSGSSKSTRLSMTKNSKNMKKKEN